MNNCVLKIKLLFLFICQKTNSRYHLNVFYIKLMKPLTNIYFTIYKEMFCDLFYFRENSR